MTNQISLFQTERVWDEIKEEVFDQVDIWHRTGVAQGGVPTKQLESVLSLMFDRKYAVTTACCTDALILALKALKLPKNAPVAVSNYTFTASAHAISRAGYQVVPVDIIDNYTIDVSQIPKEVQAVVAVDLFGNMSDWDSLSELGIPIINDAAQSLESDDGTKKSPCYGVISCISFSPSKTVSSWGSGGAALTDDPQLAENMKLLRLHGKSSNGSTAVDPGLNSVMSSFECAAVISGLRRKDDWHARRTEIAEFLIANSRFETGIDYLPKHTLHKLVFQAENRSNITDTISNKKIQTAYHYSLTINDEPLYRTLRDFPVSDRLKKISFTVPNQHTLTDIEVEQIARALK